MSNTDETEGSPLTASEAAKFLGISSNAFNGWVYRYKIPSALNEAGKSVYRRADLEKAKATWEGRTFTGWKARQREEIRQIVVSVEHVELPEPKQVTVERAAMGEAPRHHSDLKTRRERLAMVERFLGEDDELFLQLRSLTNQLETAEATWEAHYGRCLRIGNPKKRG